jgi:hypothetical protein
MAMGLINTVTVGSGGASSIEFINVPQDGTDLLLLISARATGAATAAVVITIGTPSSSAAYRTLKVVGTTVTSTSVASGRAISMNAGASTANTFSNTSAYIHNYTTFDGTSRNYGMSIDSAVEASNTTQNRIGFDATNISTSVGFFTVRIVGSLAEHSSATLYRIVNGSDGITTVS